MGPGSAGTNFCGMIIGYCRESIVYGITLKGEINVCNGEDMVSKAGGVVGYIFRCTDVSHLVNMATFPNRITTSGSLLGGVIGVLFDCPDTSFLYNTMIGDLTCITTAVGYCGGIMGMGWEILPIHK